MIENINEFPLTSVLSLAGERMRSRIQSSRQKRGDE